MKKIITPEERRAKRREQQAKRMADPEYRAKVNARNRERNANDGGAYNAHKREWRKLNPLLPRASSARWKKNHPNADKEYMQRVLKQDPDYYKRKGHKFREAHPERAKLFRDANKERINADARERHIKLRLDIINHYGGKCAFCGDSNPNHLAIDHINGGGNQHRRDVGGSSNGIYSWLKRNGYPDGFQVLCHTHNMEKGFYGIMTEVIK
jgi:hypothetical protein